MQSWKVYWPSRNLPKATKPGSLLVHHLTHLSICPLYSGEYLAEPYERIFMTSIQEIFVFMISTNFALRAKANSSFFYHFMLGRRFHLGIPPCFFFIIKTYYNLLLLYQNLVLTCQHLILTLSFHLSTCLQVWLLQTLLPRQWAFTKKNKS